MNVSVTGFDGPLARATRAELERRGHSVKASGAECAVYFPGDLAGLRALAEDPTVKRLVVRSQRLRLRHQCEESRPDDRRSRVPAATERSRPTVVAGRGSRGTPSQFRHRSHGQCAGSRGRRFARHQTGSQIRHQNSPGEIPTSSSSRLTTRQKRSRRPANLPLRACSMPQAPARCRWSMHSGPPAPGKSRRRKSEAWTASLQLDSLQRSRKKRPRLGSRKVVPRSPRRISCYQTRRAS